RGRVRRTQERLADRQREADGVSVLRCQWQAGQDRQDRGREPRLQYEFHDQPAVQELFRLRARRLGAGRQDLQRHAAVALLRAARPRVRPEQQAGGPGGHALQHREEVDRLLQLLLQQYQPQRLLRRERHVRQDQGAERQLQLRSQYAG